MTSKGPRSLNLKATRSRTGAAGPVGAEQAGAVEAHEVWLRRYRLHFSSYRFISFSS